MMSIKSGMRRALAAFLRQIGAGIDYLRQVVAGRPVYNVDEWSLLDDLAVAQHNQPVGELGYHREIMGDDHSGAPRLLADDFV